MSYRKTLKGDSNQANEEWSHNRVTIVLGSSGVIAVCFAILLLSAAIAWMMIRNGSLFSILIILSFLGVFIGAGVVGACFVATRISDALRDVRVNKILASTVVSGEVVAYRNDQNEWDHLSSIHEQGKVIPQLPTRAEQEPLPSEAYTVIDMHRQGIGMKAIAEATQWTEYAVRKLINQIDGKTK